ncbi:MAG: UDP-N-acetylglucosamine 1-carboxyvinyltransferase [Candidatus Marinimicrobia bacterium]|nr:UDP-N-acetylglucosamine 1-carboxyvinyltransferase [Candidatus Neomarinimicrobiota bacterium]
MEKFEILGARELNGKIKINGAKNALLPIMTSTLLAPGNYSLNNVPDLKDTRTMAELLRRIGASVSFKNNQLLINTVNVSKPVAPYDLVKTMRASFYVLGPLLGRLGHAEVSLPGGCAWGPRPVDIHIEALKKLGVNISLEGGNIVAKGNPIGNNIKFKFPSVGATGNLMMASVLGKGQTILKNVALEPDIISLGDFLIKMGADIKGLGTSELVINGKDRLNPVDEFDIIPDRIEAGTFLIAGAMCGGSIEIENVNPDHISIVIDKLIESGVRVKTVKNSIIVNGNKKIKPVNVTTAPYPGFPTDLQAQWIAYMTIANGLSTVTDEIYYDRFTHVPELNRLGANITMNKNTATIIGVSNLKGAPVMSTDIRASASLILASLASIGKSKISRIYHIDRGYEKIENRLKKVGADITRS